MEIHRIEDIRKLEPCYDPGRYLPEDWQGTAVDVLRVEECPPCDRLWVVLHEGWIDRRTMRLFAVWCAREALRLVDKPDPRSIEACNVAERHANGEATDEELRAAYSAAYRAAYRATYRAAYSATYSATDWAAYSAAWTRQINHLLEMLEA